MGVLPVAGPGGSISFSSVPAFQVIQANGANATVGSGNGGGGGNIRISTALASTGGDINYSGGIVAQGGAGRSTLSHGGSGGSGGSVTISTGATGGVTFLAGSSINVKGGIGADGGEGSGGSGGSGGTITARTGGSGDIAFQAGSSMDARGGNGAGGDSGGSGGRGGVVTLEVNDSSAPRSINADSISANGGNRGLGAMGLESNGAYGGGGTILFRHGGSGGGSVALGSSDARAGDGSMGSVTMRADKGDLTVDQVFASNDTLNLQSPHGHVLANSAYTTNATAKSIHVDALSGIGAAGAPLKVNEDLSVGEVEFSLHFSNTTGDVRIASDYSLNVDEGSNLGGSIYLTAAGTSGSNGSQIRLFTDKGNVTAHGGNIVYEADVLQVVGGMGANGNTITYDPGTSVQWKPYTNRSMTLTSTLLSSASWLSKITTPNFIFGDQVKTTAVVVDAPEFAQNAAGIGKLTLKSSGDVSQTGPLRLNVPLQVNAGGGVALNMVANGGNAIAGGIDVVAGGDVDLANMGALTLGGINSGSVIGNGTITVNNTGSIEITGTITAAGTGLVNLTATGPGGSITETVSGLISTTGLLSTSSTAGQTLNGLNSVSSFSASNTSGGDVKLANTKSQLLIDNVSNDTGTIEIVNNGGLMLKNGAVISSGFAGDALQLAGNSITNVSATLTTPNGRWLLWSQSPANDTLGGLSASFRQYNATYGSTSVQTQTVGNGLLYKESPSLALTLGSSGSTSKEYDGTTAFNGGSFTGSTIYGDSAVIAGTFAYDNKNVGTDKLITATVTGAIQATNGGVPVYGLQAAAGGPLNITGGAITVRPLSTWKAPASGDWSNPDNWDALPDGNNVLAVSLPGAANVVVTFDDKVANTTLQSLNGSQSLAFSSGTLSVSGALVTAGLTQSNGALTAGTLTSTQTLALAGGTLGVSGAVTAGGLAQTGGALTAGNLTVSDSFNQTGGSIVVGAQGKAAITQTTGNLVVGSLSAPAVSLTAKAGGITQTAPIVSPSLITLSVTGADLGNAGNQINTFNAANIGSGNINLVNTGVLDITGISNANGNVLVDNTGGVTTTGAVIAINGDAGIHAHSPLTIGSGGVTATKNISLTAGGAAGSNSNLTLSGNVTSTGGGTIGLAAGDNLTQNAAVASNGGNISAFAQRGSLGMGSAATTSSGGGSIGYAAPAGNLTLASLNAGATGTVAVTAGQGIGSAAGFTGANMIGKSGIIVAGGNANLTTQVSALDATIEGKFTITDATTGNAFTDAPAPVVTPVVTSDPVVTTKNLVDALTTAIVTTTQSTTAAQSTTSQSSTTAAVSTPADGSGAVVTLTLGATGQTTGGGPGQFGSTSSDPDPKDGTPSGGGTAKPKPKPEAEDPGATKPAAKPAAAKSVTCG